MQISSHQEWDSEWVGPDVIVEVLETTPTELNHSGYIITNGTNVEGMIHLYYSIKLIKKKSEKYSYQIYKF